MALYLDGVQPVLSDVRVITKYKGDTRSVGPLLDRKKAGSTCSSRCAEQATLPEVSDAVNVIVKLSAAKPLDDFLSDLGVLDFPDASWLIPLHRKGTERDISTPDLARSTTSYYARRRTAVERRWLGRDSLRWHRIKLTLAHVPPRPQVCATRSG